MNRRGFLQFAGIAAGSEALRRVVGTTTNGTPTPPQEFGYKSHKSTVTSIAADKEEAGGESNRLGEKFTSNDASIQNITYSDEQGEPVEIKSLRLDLEKIYRAGFQGSLIIFSVNHREIHGDSGRDKDGITIGTEVSKVMVLDEAGITDLLKRNSDSFPRVPNNQGKLDVLPNTTLALPINKNVKHARKNNDEPKELSRVAGIDMPVGTDELYIFLYEEERRRFATLTTQGFPVIASDYIIRDQTAVVITKDGSKSIPSGLVEMNYQHLANDAYNSNGGMPN